MTKSTIKALKKIVIAVPLLAAAIYFIPVVTTVFLATGLADVLRNVPKSADLFVGYFLGNGVFTWLLSPFNLLIDSLSYRNPGVWTLEDFPPDYRAEIEAVLSVFQRRRSEIMSDIDASFPSGRRGMYVFQWFGRRHIDTIEEFNRPFRYIRTIAVSVFDGREMTSLHFGPLRLTLRVLYNLEPAKTDQVFIECGSVRNLWYENPLFIFDDTLRHRSVNLHDARRYCVFMDVMRPSPLPRLLSALLKVISMSVDRFNAVFYKNWRMIGKKPELPENAG